MSPRRATSLAILCTFSLLTACGSDATDESMPATDSTAATVSPIASPGPVPVDVVAVDYSFQAPDSIPPGWTTLRLENRGREPHFVILWKLPEGKTLADYGRDVGPAFDQAYAALQEGQGKAEAGALLGGLLPDWYAGVEPRGGVGLLSPGRAARATVELEPGTYVLECYVKTPAGVFHAALGMAHQLVVAGPAADAGPPVAEGEITLANDGITAPDTVPAGERTLAVHFATQPEVGLGNDVHVVRLEAGMDPGAVIPWMDWMNLDGLRSPAPATFVGGAQEMPVGRTEYFTVDLEPGRYAWIGEAPEEAPKVRPFVVE